MQNNQAEAKTVVGNQLKAICMADTKCQKNLYEAPYKQYMLDGRQ